MEKLLYFNCMLLDYILQTCGLLYGFAPILMIHGAVVRPVVPPSRARDMFWRKVCVRNDRISKLWLIWWPFRLPV